MNLMSAVLGVSDDLGDDVMARLQFGELLSQALNCHPEESIVVGAVASCMVVVAETKTTVPFLCSSGAVAAVCSIIEADAVDEEGACAGPRCFFLCLCANSRICACVHALCLRCVDLLIWRG